MKRTLEFLQDVPDALKSDVTLFWVPNPRSEPVTPADINASLHKVKSIVCLDDERSAVAENPTLCASLESELALHPVAPSDNAMILFTRCDLVGYYHQFFLLHNQRVLLVLAPVHQTAVRLDALKV